MSNKRKISDITKKCKMIDMIDVEVNHNDIVAYKTSNLFNCNPINPLDALVEVSVKMLENERIDEQKMEDCEIINAKEMPNVKVCDDTCFNIMKDDDIYGDVDDNNEKNSKKTKRDEIDIIKINYVSLMYRNELYVDNVRTRDIAIEVMKKFHRMIIETTNKACAIMKMISLNDIIVEKNKKNEKETLPTLDNNQRMFLIKQKHVIDGAITYIKEKFSDFLNREKIISLFLDDKYDINEKIGSISIVHYFVAYCNYDNIKKIFEKNIDINSTTEDNVTFLHMIMIGPKNVSSDDKYLIIKLLIDNGIDVNLSEKRYGMTILHMLCNLQCTINADNKVKIVDLIMKNNGDPTIKMKKDNWTSIDCAKNMLKHDNNTYTKILNIMMRNI